jgi:hypothetical protein
VGIAAAAAWEAAAKTTIAGVSTGDVDTTRGGRVHGGGASW